MIIRATTAEDKNAISELAAANGFEPEEIKIVNKTLAAYLSGDSEALWLSAIAPDDELVGILYCTPEAMTNGTWNILMILVLPNYQQQGYGKALMTHIETALVERDARLIIVETSSTEDFEGARAFYPKCGYSIQARIPDFYDAGNDKLVFGKTLQ